MKSITDCYLYGIVDLGYIQPNDCRRVAEQMIAGGVDIVQLRAKQASVSAIIDLAGELHQITSAAGVPLIVNDYPQVAREVPIEGVHVGQDDESVSAAREQAGRPLIVGKSTHSAEQARAAAAEKPDYIGFGPLFATPTKPDYPPIGLRDIADVHRELSVPIFCIGGIKLEKLAEVIAAGAKRVVIVSGLLTAKDIASYARSCKALLHPQP